MVTLNPPLVAKNGSVLCVLLICRVSSPGEGRQREESNDDQEVRLRKWLDDHWDGEVNTVVIAGTGSGERVDRPEYLEATSAVESGQYDLVLAEDLSRISRRIHAQLFCELAQDANCRVIAANSEIDTGRPDWRLAAGFNSMRHEMYNSDSSGRIRRSQRNLFIQGRLLSPPICGHLLSPGAKYDSEMSKDPSAEAIYDQWFTMLENGASFSEVADWLNAEGVPTGPSCKSDTWDCRIVGRVTRNPILKGERVWNNRMSQRINATGRRKSVPAPDEERLKRACPHLAFIDPVRYDRVVSMLDERNSHYRRKGTNGQDGRAGVSKKRTRFPGQCMFCGVCGRMYVFGGHGQTDHLQCGGTRSYQCWNGATVDGPLATEKISTAILSEIESQAGFDELLLKQIAAEEKSQDASRTERLGKLQQSLAKTERELENVLKAIRSGINAQSVKDDLASLEQEENALTYELRKERQKQDAEFVLPDIESLKSLGCDYFSGHTKNSYEFAARLRILVPRIVVSPYQLVDGGRVVLRAKFRLQLANLIPDQRASEVLRTSLERVLQVDLYDAPQRAQFREEVVAARSRGATEKQIAAALGITHTAAQRAMALQRQMDAMEINDPYILLTSPPANGGKIKRHKHSRYKFEPLPDAGVI
jgi:site-specific DNA recombinase